MADISKITLPDGNYYNLKDKYARNGIPFGIVDSTSTATAFTATVEGITELRDGTCVLLKNGVVTSAAGFTVNINGLGAKPVYNNLTANTADTTIFNVSYTMLFVYDSTRVQGGGWICYRGYDSNTNTIGYQIRTNASSLPVSQVTYRYRLLFTSADGTHYVPANASTSTNATAKRAVNQEKIDPFGDIRIFYSTGSVAVGSRPGTSTIFQQYNGFALGYSFNTTGAALTLTAWEPVYLRCALQDDGSAIMDADEPIVQTIPKVEDNNIYIFLGIAISATNIQLILSHPVYKYRNGHVQIFSGNDTITRVKGNAESSYRTGDVNITAENIGSFPEAYLTWGGKNFIGNYGPLDAAVIDTLGANRFAFLKPAGLTIEYSTDSGESWSDYGSTDTEKTGLFGRGQNHYLGKHSENGTSTIGDMLRVTISTSAAGVYTELNKIVIYMSTKGNATQVKIEKALQSTPNDYNTHLDWTQIAGYSGWNVLNIPKFTTYGNSANVQYGRIRFTFRQTAISATNTAALINIIRGYGGMGWTCPSNMAKDGHLYSYDNSQNATFPANVRAPAFYANNKAVLTGGSNAESSVSITPSTTDIYSITNVGTLPTLTFEMDTTDTKKLKITFNQGTLPSRSASAIKAWTGYTEATAAAQVFTGSSD